MAKDLVRTRSHVQKMIKMKTQLQAVSLRLQTVKSQNAMATAIKGVARVRRHIICIQHAIHNNLSSHTLCLQLD